MQHEQNWIALAEILGARSPLFKPLLTAFTTPEAIFAASEEELRAALPDAGIGVLKSLLGKRTAETARGIALWCHQNGVRILPFDHKDYPAVLRELDEPPVLLYCRGRLPDLGTRACVGVVGPRRTDAYGEQVTYKISFELAAAGAVIVSGLADGVDGIATAAALLAGGTPVAVLGCGIDVTYPRHHARLLAECIERGAVLTEYAPGTPPNGYNFPIRNRLISALSDALVVTEANAESGSLITARYALLQGKTLFAVPGDIDRPRSVGTNGLIRSGALLALSGEDVLAHFRFLYPQLGASRVPLETLQYTEATAEKLRAHGIPSVLDDAAQDKIEKSHTVSAHSDKKAPAAPSVEPPQSTVSAEALDMLDPRQRELYEMLPDGVFSLDHLTSQGVPSGEAAATLTVLELYGILCSCPGGTYRKQ